MDGIDPIGRLLIVVGVLLAILGMLIVVVPSVALGRLPGDIHIDRGNVQVYLPFGTMIVVSVVITILLNILGFFGRDR